MIGSIPRGGIGYARGMRVSQDLSTAKWTVRAVGAVGGAVGDLSRVPAAVRERVVRGIPATLLPEVGGCVHTDLIDAGLIGDPAVGVNEQGCAWVSWTDWCYECEFEAFADIHKHHETDLVFEALDTIAEVELNGVVVGRANSEFIPWRFAVKGAIRHGKNRLRITFTSPLRHAYNLAKTLSLPHNGDESVPPWHPYNMMRKCASNFGWDWGPRIATCGIGGSVRVEGWSHVRIDEPIRVVESSGVLNISVPLWWPGERDRPESMDVGGELRIGQEVMPLSAWELTLDIVPRLETDFRSAGVLLEAFVDRRWAVDAPVLATGHIDCSVRIDGELRSDRIAIRTGFRTAEWSDDGLRLNGKPVFCKGVNWIPEGLWPRDRTRAKIRARLEQAKAMGCNMIRVWGGGRYESDAFYEICDELGLMVWQDFMFACACYPEEDPFPALIEAEARYQVARLSKHPCIVLWCGGNENHWAHESWGFGARVTPGRGWGKAYWQEMLPRIVKELSPHTPYVPDSPWSPPTTPPTHPNATEVGDRHTWDLFGDDFRSHVPRFCSEFGVQSPSNLPTLREADLLEGPAAADDRPSAVGERSSAVDHP
jgi:beta-mannosidase